MYLFIYFCLLCFSSLCFSYPFRLLFLQQPPPRSNLRACLFFGKRHFGAALQRPCQKSSGGAVIALASRISAIPELIPIGYIKHFCVASALGVVKFFCCHIGFKKSFTTPHDFAKNKLPAFFFNSGLQKVLFLLEAHLLRTPPA